MKNKELLELYYKLLFEYYVLFPEEKGSIPCVNGINSDKYNIDQASLISSILEIYHKIESERPLISLEGMENYNSARCLINNMIKRNKEYYRFFGIPNKIKSFKIKRRLKKRKLI